ncbi:MAG: hypothetical protein R3A79_22080 [Nannocystaceae bacterium]
METTALDEQVAALEVLAEYLERPVDPEEVIDTESQLFPGYLVVEGAHAHFLCSRFGAWEVMASFASGEASGIEVHESFAGSGHELRVLLRGQLLRFGGLDGDTARRIARRLVAGGAEVGGGGGRARVAPSRAPARAFSASIQAPKAYVAQPSREVEPVALSAAPPAPPPSWGAQAASWGVSEDDASDEDDDDDDDDGLFDAAFTAAEAGDQPDNYTEAELAAILDKWEDKTETARETAKVNAAAEAIRPARRGIVAAVLYYMATIFVLTSGAFDELYLDPQLGYVAGPALAWLLVAVPGGLVSGLSRTFVLVFYALLAAATTVGIADYLGSLELSAMVGWFLLSYGAINAYVGSNAVVKSLGVMLGIFMLTGGQALTMPMVDIALQVGIFWAIHAVLEKATLAKQPA